MGAPDFLDKFKQSLLVFVCSFFCFFGLGRIRLSGGSKGKDNSTYCANFLKDLGMSDTSSICT